MIFLLFFMCMLSLCAGKGTLQVVWMSPVRTPDEANYHFNASTSVGALALGLQTVRASGFLPNHDINITLIDSECSSKESVGKLVDLLSYQTVDAVIGPPCAKVVPPIGELMAYRDIPMINWVSVGQTFDDYKTDLTTYIRVMSPVSSLGGLMVQFYYQFEWKRLIMISTLGDAYEAGAAVIEESLIPHKQNNFTIVHHYSNVRRNATSDIIDNMFESIKHEGRIIILVIPKEDLRQYMIRAYDLGMAGGDYQFLFTATELEDHKDTELLHSDRLWRNNDENDFKARKGFENVLYFVLGHSTVPTYYWQNNSYDAYNRVFSGRTDIPTPQEPDEYSPYLHDAIVLYAYLVNKSTSGNFSRNGLDLFRFSTYVIFKGLSGDVVMNLRADRQPSFFVYDLDYDGTFQQVVTIRWTIDSYSNNARMNITTSSIVWGDGRTSDDYFPPDIPPCGFFNEKCPEESPDHQSYEIIIGVVSAAMLIVLLILFLIYRWYRGEQSLKNLWKVNYEDLCFTVGRKGRSSSGHLSDRSLPSNGTINCGSMRGTIVSGSSGHHNMITRGQIFTTVGIYKGEIVAVKMSKRKRISTDRGFMIEMKNMIELKHTNLTNFLGVCTTPEKVCSVWEYCNKGSIQDVIENDDIRLDTMFKLSFAIDICQGLEYIHKSHIKFHGKLQSSNCVIDSRWVCKLTDFGVRRLSSLLDDTEEELGEHAYYARLFWTAPEVLRKILKRESCPGSQASDVYALGIILKEILCRNEPYGEETYKSPKEIIEEIAYPKNPDYPLRPELGSLEVDGDNDRVNLEFLISKCWEEDTEQRPSSKRVLRALNKINPYKKSSVVDNMIVMMEKYTNNLEELVAERTEQLQDEKRKTDQLLYRMLPRKVADDLKFGRSVQAEAFDSVTIYFSDIVEFTTLAGESTPLQIVDLLNSLYTMFDDIIAHFDVYKVETIGDAYMIVSGLPEKNGNLHVREISHVALNILQHVLTFKIPHKPDKQLEIRIGLHTGPVVAGVVGLTMPRYCLFGDTVNTASRMESNGKVFEVNHPEILSFGKGLTYPPDDKTLALKIHISPSTKAALDGFPKFITEDRGELHIKGKGVMRTYWLTGIDETVTESPKRQQEFDKLIEPDNKTRDESDISDHVTSINRLKVSSESEGKVSVADSGIVVDKHHEDDKHGGYRADLDDLDTDSDSSSSDGLIFIKEGSSPGHTIRYAQHRSKSLSPTDDLTLPHRPKLSLPAIINKRIFPSEESAGTTVTQSNSFKGHREKVVQESKRQRNSFSFGQKLLRKRSEKSARKVKDIPKSKRLKVKKDKETLDTDHQHIANIENKVDDTANVTDETDDINLPTELNSSSSPALDQTSSKGTTSVDQNQMRNDTQNNSDYTYDARTRTSIFTIPHRVSATDFMAPQNHWDESKL